MGYRKIPNLYKADATQAFMLLDECYALEKIHGTSAHVAWSREDGFKYFSGGIKHETFMEMIDERFPSLEADIITTADFAEVNSVILYGEAYGGKCQKMARVYGPLNFIVFEVKVDGEWAAVPNAEIWAKAVSLPFVYYKRGPATLEFVNAQRDLPSQQAIRNGICEDGIGEGIVIRSVDEKQKDKFGNRIIIKHKREEFRETKTPREVDPEQARIWKEAQEVAEEFVVPMRLDHVIDKLVATKPGFEFDVKNIRTVIGAMIADVRKEEGDTIEWSKTIQRAIGTRTAGMFKEYLSNRLKEKMDEGCA